MKLRMRMIAAALLAALCLSGCVPQASLPEIPAVLPTFDPSAVPPAPENCAQAAYQEQAVLWYPNESGSRLMAAIDRPNARCQWQPPIKISEEECLASIEMMRPWIANVHVFSWDFPNRLPLAAHESRWKKYLASLAGDRTALMEFVCDDDPNNLVTDAKVLHSWLEEV